MMPIENAEDVKTLVRQQLDSITDELVHAGILEISIEPFLQYRQWVYGAEQYACWVVAEHSESNTRYVYCAEGFSPALPWGIVSASGLEMGMDSGWFQTLEDAFYDSFAAIPLPVWNLVKRGVTGSDRVVESSLTHDQADALIAQRNAETATAPNSWQIYAVEPRTKVWW